MIATPEPSFTAEPLRAGLVGDELRHVKNDRDSAGCLLRSNHREGATCDYHVWRQRGQFGRVFAYVICIARGPTMVDSQIATDRPAQFV